MSKKIALIALAAAIVVGGVAYVTLQQDAAVVSAANNPSDFGLKDGDRITAHQQAADPDIFVVKETHIQGAKRNFKSEAICYMYGQFGVGGCFAAGLKQVSAAVRDAFVLGCYYTNGDTKDGKVYYMESTGSDSGTLHHVAVDGATAVAADPLFFIKTFTINNSEQNFYTMGSAYTSMSQLPACSTGQSGTPTPTPGAVSVSLSASTPVATTVTTNAQGVEFLRVRLAGTGTISSLTAKRVGAGATGDFDNLYWYEGARRLTTGKGLQSSTGEVTFSNLSWAVSGSRELSLVGDLSATAGNVNAFELTSATLTAGTISGMPVRGNNMTVSGATSGTITMAKVGSIANPNVGTKGAQLSEFKLTTATEAGKVLRITMLQGGTVKPGDITNLKLKTGAANEWSGTIDSNGYAVFDLGAGFTIAKGNEAVFKVYGDVTGKRDEDVNLYFEYSGDIQAIGDQFGFGMAATITAMDAASEAHDMTLQGGVLTIAFNGPSASNIGTDTSDTVLLRYSMTVASNIEVKETEFTLCHDPGGDGSYAAAADTTNGWADLDDFKVTNEDTGSILIDSVDGSAFTVSDAAGGTCEDSVTGAQKKFTDVYELMAGKTYSFKVTADIKTANTRSGTALASTDDIKVFLDNFTDDTPSVSVMKYAGTNTSVADADIVPQSDMGGPAMTLQSASLTLGLSSAVNSQTFVRGTNKVNAIGITFKAAQASPLTVTDIVLSGYARDATSGDFTLGAEGVTGITVANLVNGVKLYESESGALISSTIASNHLSNTTGTVTFNNLNWVLPAGGTKTLLVEVDLSSNPTSDSTNDHFAFDINATTDVTALDSSSKTVNAGNSDLNSGVTGTVNVTVKNSGTLAVAVSTASTPRDHAVYWGQMGDKAGVWRFTATDEAQFIERAQFGEYDSGGTQETDLATNAKTVYINYKNKAGTTLTKSGTFSAAGTVSFGFTGDERPYVPKDSTMDATILIDYKTKGEGATTGKTWDLDFIGDSGSGTDTFKASGEGSGIVLKGDSTNITNQDQDTGGTDIRNYRVFPEFKLIAPAATKLSTVDPVLSFTVTAKGLTDSRVFFDNTAAGSGSIKFAVLASGIGLTADSNFTVRKANNVIVDTGSITNSVYSISGGRASMTIDFGTLDVEVTGGSTETLHVYLDNTSDFNTPSAPGAGADYFQLVLRDDEAGLINWVDNSTVASTDLDTASTIGFLEILPMSGYLFTAQ